MHVVLGSGEELPYRCADYAHYLERITAQFLARVDRQRMVDVFVNLLDNAAKFMGEQAEPRVEIHAEAEGGRVTVRVCDNGVGIEAGQHERVFGLFERLIPRAPDRLGQGLRTANMASRSRRIYPRPG